MLNLNKYTKTKTKPTATLISNIAMTHAHMSICKNCSHVCAYHCVQLSYTTQHRTVLIIFPLIPQTIITAQMMSTGGEADHNLINQLHETTDVNELLMLTN